MQILYFNNFRGFDKTFLSLKDVNFFVGENSTGKTSVLKLIKIISSGDFFYHLNLDSNETDLGYFSEIASQGSSNQDYFEIGFLNNEKQTTGKKTYAAKLKFINFNGIPQVSEFSILQGAYSIELRLEGNVAEYRYSKFGEKDIPDIEKYFKKWINNNELGNLPFKPLEEPRAPVIWRVLFEIMKNEKGFSDVSVPVFLKDPTWFAPIRTEPKRTYDSYKSTFSPDGKHTPYVLKNLLHGTKKNSERNVSKAVKMLTSFGKRSGMYDGISINTLDKASGSAPFEVLIHVGDRKLKIINVGYGISQILPLITEIVNVGKGEWFAIQQPEIHLHPRGQAAFGELIYDAFHSDKKRFIIETHSDYTIDRFRLLLNRNDKSKQKLKIESQIVFFDKRKGNNALYAFNINSDGSYPINQPKAFREFFLKEQLNLISI